MLHLDSEFILAQPPHVQHHLLLARSLVLLQRREAAPRLPPDLALGARMLWRRATGCVSESVKSRAPLVDVVPPPRVRHE